MKICAVIVHHLLCDESNTCCEDASKILFGVVDCTDNIRCLLVMPLFKLNNGQSARLAKRCSRLRARAWQALLVSEMQILLNENTILRLSTAVSHPPRRKAHLSLSQGLPPKPPPHKTLSTPPPLQSNPPLSGLQKGIQSINTDQSQVISKRIVYGQQFHRISFNYLFFQNC